MDHSKPLIKKKNAKDNQVLKHSLGISTVLTVEGENGLDEVDLTPPRDPHLRKLRIGSDYGSSSFTNVASVVSIAHHHDKPSAIGFSPLPRRTHNSGSFAKRSYSVSQNMIFMESQEPHIENSSGDVADKHPHQDERPNQNHATSIPANYLAANSQFPSRDLYLHTIKSQYFSLGVSAGAAMQMFLVSFLLMFVSTSDNAGPIRELSHEYYPVFRGVFLLTFFFCLYGTCLFIWHRNKVDYASTLGLSYAHTYQYVLRGSSTISYIIFSCFMLYILTLTGGLDTITFVSQNELKHLWPALAFFGPLLLFFCPFDSVTVCCFGVIRNGFRQRMDLLRDLGKVFSAPFFSSDFRLVRNYTQ